MFDLVSVCLCCYTEIKKTKVGLKQLLIKHKLGIMKLRQSIVDLSWLIKVYQGFDIIYSFHGTALDRGTLSLTFDLCFCKFKIF